MRPLRAKHILLLRILSQHCLFLTRRQIERVLGIHTNSTNKVLIRLIRAKYLERCYRTDQFGHFEILVYFLGRLGWEVVGRRIGAYKTYQTDVEQRSGRITDHQLAVYDVLLKFILESRVKRIIGSEDSFWHESLDFGNVPDAWIEFEGGASFVEVDRGTESRQVVGKKLERYAAFKHSGNHQLMFPNCRFSVLFITTTELRIEQLERRTTCDDIWFGTMDEFLKEPLNHRHWFAYRGFYALPPPTKEAM